MKLEVAALDQLFNKKVNRITYRQERPIPDSLLIELHDLMNGTRPAPIAGRCARSSSTGWKPRPSPRPAADGKATRSKTMAAPVTACLAWTWPSTKNCPACSAHRRQILVRRQRSADRRHCLPQQQPARCLLHARRARPRPRLWPDVRFRAAAVDAEFFTGTQIKCNFICSLGYGDAAQLFPRSPRPSFAEICRIV